MTRNIQAFHEGLCCLDRDLETQVVAAVAVNDTNPSLSQPSQPQQARKFSPRFAIPLHQTVWQALRDSNLKKREPPKVESLIMGKLNYTNVSHLCFDPYADIKIAYHQRQRKIEGLKLGQVAAKDLVSDDLPSS